jgi:hypothetical protein
METYTKVTIGFVTQTFTKKDDGNFICTDQEFIAGDEVNYEDDMGDAVEVDTSKELYQDMSMRSPDGGDIIDDRWSLTDVQDRYKDMHENKEPLSDDIARKIIHLCHDKMDANEGINWGVIDYWTGEVLNPESRVNEKR